MAKREVKVRMRSQLPTAMRVQDWLEMVTGKSGTNRLGALAFYEHELCVVAYLGGQVHAIGMADAREGSALQASLNADDLAILEDWISQYDAGRFSVLEEKGRKLKQASTW